MSASGNEMANKVFEAPTRFPLSTTATAATTNLPNYDKFLSVGGAFRLPALNALCAWRMCVC